MHNGVIGCLFVLFIVVAVFSFNFFVGGWCLHYTVDFWADYVKGVDVTIPFLPCGVAAIFLAEIVIPVAVLTWILSYIL